MNIIVMSVASATSVSESIFSFSPLLVVLCYALIIWGIVRLVKFLIKNINSKEESRHKNISKEMLALSAKYKSGEISKEEYEQQRAQLINGL